MKNKKAKLLLAQIYWLYLTVVRFYLMYAFVYGILNYKEVFEISIALGVFLPILALFLYLAFEVMCKEAMEKIKKFNVTND